MAAMAASGITVRVRSQLGMWRFRDVNPDEPARTLMARIETKKNVPLWELGLPKACNSRHGEWRYLTAYSHHVKIRNFQNQSFAAQTLVVLNVFNVFARK